MTVEQLKTCEGICRFVRNSLVGKNEVMQGSDMYNVYLNILETMAGYDSCADDRAHIFSTTISGKYYAMAFGKFRYSSNNDIVVNGMDVKFIWLDQTSYGYDLSIALYIIMNVFDNYDIYSEIAIAYIAARVFSYTEVDVDMYTDPYAVDVVNRMLKNVDSVIPNTVDVCKAINYVNSKRHKEDK